MPEMENASAGAEGAGEVEKKDGEANTENQGASGEQTPEEKKAAEDAAKVEADAAAAKQAEDDKAEPTVRARKTAKDFIIERKERKIAKLKANEQAGKDDEDGEDDDENDGVDPEDEKVINQVVSKRLAPLIERQMDEEDTVEVQQFVATNPDFKPYEAKVLRFMKHPSRRDVPIEDLFYAAAGKDLIKIGAKLAKKAEDEAARSGTGGGSARTEEGEGKKDWASMGTKEFEQEKLAVMYPDTAKK